MMAALKSRQGGAPEVLDRSLMRSRPSRGPFQRDWSPGRQGEPASAPDATGMGATASFSTARGTASDGAEAAVLIEDLGTWAVETDAQIEADRTTL